MIITIIAIAIILYATMIFYWLQQPKPKLRPIPINKRQQQPPQSSQFPHS
jgi:hypothetical protein